MTAQVSPIQNPPENPCAGQPAAKDGHLPSTVERLTAAIAALCDPIKGYVDNRRYEGDPLYVQLRESLPGNRGTGGTNTGFTGCWITALDLLTEIDGTTAAWTWTRGADLTRSGPATIVRLHHLEQHRFRPQDCAAINQISDICEQWVASIKALLDPPPRVGLPSPCPQCGARIVYRHDSGELVRQAALQIGPQGCQCGRCRTVWAPDAFVFLATRLLGYALPAGVLE